MLRFDERVHLPKNRENTITFLVNGEPIGTVETLAPGAKTVDIPIPPVDYDSVTNALGYTPYNSTNPSGYITSSALNGYATQSWVTSQGYTTNTGTVTSVNNVQPVNGNVTISIPTIPTNISAFTNDSGYITSSALTGYATQSWVGQQGYITGIDSTDVTNALGYTPYNATNPNGYITTSALTPYALSADLQTALDTKVSKSGDTMTGALSIEQDTGSGGTEGLNLKSNVIEKGVTPSSNLYSPYIIFKDKNENTIGNIYIAQRSDSGVRLSFGVPSPTGGATSYAFMGFDASGNSICSFPHTTCVDGQWVYKNTSLGSKVTWNASSHSDAKGYSLSSYLPNDGQKYEVLIRAQGTTTSTSGKFISVGITSDIITAQVYVCRCKTRSSSSVICSGNIIIPVGTGRKITVAGAGSEASADGTYDIACVGYRRIGTNS